MPFVSCSKFNQSQALQDQAIADLAQDLADGTSPTGAAGGDLQGTYPNPTVKDQAIVDAVTGSKAVQTAVANVFNRCNGTDMPAGASLIECSAKGTDIPYLVGGVIPASQLPAYVDDVLEFPALAKFPATGEAGKIYIDAGTGKTYRWNGTGYTEISASAGITVQDEGTILTTAATSLKFVGSGINATSSGGAVTVTVPSATTTQSGTSELATDAETIAGTSTTTVVTPAGLKAATRIIDAYYVQPASTINLSSPNRTIMARMNSAILQSGTAPVTYDPATGRFTFGVSGWWQFGLQSYIRVQATNPNPADYGRLLFAATNIDYAGGGGRFANKEQQLSSALLPYLSFAGNLTPAIIHFNAGEWVSPNVVGGYADQSSVGTNVTLQALSDIVFNLALVQAD